MRKPDVASADMSVEPASPSPSLTTRQDEAAADASAPAPKRKRLLAGQTEMAHDISGDSTRGPSSRRGEADRKSERPTSSAPPTATSRKKAPGSDKKAAAPIGDEPELPSRLPKAAKAAKVPKQSAADPAEAGRPLPPKRKAVSGRENAHLKRLAREEAEATAVADDILAARAREAGVAEDGDGDGIEADGQGGFGDAGSGRPSSSFSPRRKSSSFGAEAAAPALFGADLHGRSLPAYLDEKRWGSMASAGVHSSLLGKLSARFGFNKATPVQAAAFEVITCSLERCPEGPSRYDIALHSETGSGKTLAYLLPLLSWLLETTPSASALHHARTRIVIVTPTRELAHQVFTVAETVCRAGARRAATAESWAASVRAAEGKKAKKTSGASTSTSSGAGAGGGAAPPTVGSVSSASLLRVAKLVGEVPQSVLRDANEGGEAPHVIIGTPATLSKLIPARINAGQLSAIILDEADELVRNHSIAAVTSLVGWASKLKHRPAVVAVSATPSHGLSAFLAKHARVASLRTINMLESAAAAAAAGATGGKPRTSVSLSAAVRADAAAEAAQAAALAAVEAETGVAADGALVPAAGAVVTTGGAGGASTSTPASAAEDPSYYLSRAALRLALPPTLTHLVLPVSAARDTFPTFTRWLAAAKPQAVLSFHNSVESLEATELFLRGRNVRARVLGSAYDVAQRHASIEDVKTGRAQVLLATEMAARGLDIPRLSHVMNFDAPANAREYVHRAGRVGRLSSTTPNRRGVVVTMTVGDQQYSAAVRMLRDELGLATKPPAAAPAAAVDASLAKETEASASADPSSPVEATAAAISEAEALAASAAAAASSSATPKLLRLAPLMRADCIRGELQFSLIE